VIVDKGKEKIDKICDEADKEKGGPPSEKKEPAK